MSKAMCLWEYFFRTNMFSTGDFFNLLSLIFLLKMKLMKNILDFFTRVRKNAIKLLKKGKYLLLVVLYAGQLYPRLNTLGVLYYIG